MLVPSQLSLESAVTGDTPPTFLWATVGDNTVPVENTMLYATALRRAGVPFELHLYGDGPHAMGLATAESVWRPDYVNPHAATWHGLCVEWNGLRFAVRAAQPVCVGEETLYWWALLAVEDGEAQTEQT